MARYGIISSLTLYYGKNPRNHCKINGFWDSLVFHENRTNIYGCLVFDLRMTPLIAFSRVIS